MATCYDCIHTYPCKYDRFFGVDEVENKCHYFENKAEYAEVKHGYWIKEGNKKTCSVCGFFYHSNNDDWNGCPNCLAKMDGRRDV